MNQKKSDLVFDFLETQKEIREELLSCYDSLIVEILKIISNSNELSIEQKDEISFLLCKKIVYYNSFNDIVYRIQDILHIEFEM